MRCGVEVLSKYQHSACWGITEPHSVYWPLLASCLCTQNQPRTLPPSYFLPAAAPACSSSKAEPALHADTAAAPVLVLMQCLLACGVSIFKAAENAAAQRLVCVSLNWAVGIYTCSILGGKKWSIKCSPLGWFDHSQLSKTIQTKTDPKPNESYQDYVPRKTRRPTAHCSRI